MIELIGSIKLADLKARDVQAALTKLAKQKSTRSVRHTFVSLLSASGVPIEQIANAVGHSSTWTTENIYRHQLRPVLRTAATALGPLFVGQPNRGPDET